MYTVKRFGVEQEPVVIFDDFAVNPEALKQTASQLPFRQKGPYYPGIRAGADPSYLQDRISELTDILKTVFDLTKGVRIAESNFSLVTTPEDKLMPIQSLPHHDTTDPGRIAMLHYLCGAEKGGTAFYRHKSTGFETVTAARHAAFKTALEADFSGAEQLPRGYFRGTSDQYDRIGHIDAKFNRCIFYRGITLHSGDIPQDFHPDPNPDAGRLSVNIFMQAK